MPSRSPSRSVLMAIALVVILTLWLAFGDLASFRDTPPEAAPTPKTALTRVEIMERDASDFSPYLLIQGQLNAESEVALRARQSGQVAGLPVSQGRRVSQGDVLLEIDQQALPARLNQAQSELTLAQAELDGAERLRQRSMISDTEYLRLQSQLSRARAEVATLRRELDDTRPQAPFAGRLDRLDVELGDELQAGETWGLLIEDNRLIAKGWVPQRQALDLDIGLPATVRLLDGSELNGTLNYVSRRADEATRSFAIEVILDNPEQRRLAGASATIELALPTKPVHRVSPGLLHLTADGRLALKHLDTQNRVILDPVELVSSDADQARVAGLPEHIRLITLGAGFVAPGEQVEPVLAASNPDTAGPVNRPQATNADAAP
ncbi:efflux RND transporter periplasmic adaptor subunit [Halomonas halocynthiae]|uniref:efflux RND transporter periplasmic adaptor subunit n=1 Tax=Halomonas halocynthiae TaxID=176290 RepID=UPI000401B13D|nr:efflux RND transporter periplasmic adaptor subunit [Halomonas halocynthiae]